jgi:hypothetical protein
MSRLFAIALGLLGMAGLAPGQSPPSPPTQPVGKIEEAAETSPDRLLSPTTQLYLRWDGIAAHNEAYKKSIWGGVMAGPSGDTIRSLVAKLPKLLGGTLVADPLLAGQPKEELKANLTDLKQASKLIDLVAEKGIIVAAEVREPSLTVKGLGTAIGGLLGGSLPGAEAVVPDAHLLLIVPDVGERSEAIFAALRLATRKGDVKLEPFSAAGRTGLQFSTPDKGGPPIPIRAAWWMEGKHFVIYAGTMNPENMVAEMTANARKGGVMAHPHYKRSRENPGFESITRGFVDTGRVVSMARSLAGPFVPGLATRIDDLGLANLKAVVFNSGFDGKESRAIYEFDLPGERKGLGKVLKQEAIRLEDLPPMPPDVSRFGALRVDPAATYDAGIMVIESLLLNQSFGVEDDARTPAEAIKLRRAFIEKEADKYAGVNIREELLPYLGDKVVVFQSPSEGLSVFGTVVCVSLKDPAKVKNAADRVQRGLEKLLGQTKVRKKLLRGVEIREIYSRDLGFITPAYAIVGDWLVVGIHPQAVQGFVLRTKGEIPSWKPDAATAARLAKMPAGGGLQYCDPRSTVQNLCCIGPLFLGTFALRSRFNPSEADYDPIDVGLIPNGHELSKHLFPNLTVTRDNGKTIRVDVNESFSMPLEVIGLEPFTFAAMIGLFAL